MGRHGLQFEFRVVTLLESKPYSAKRKTLSGSGTKGVTSLKKRINFLASFSLSTIASPEWEVAGSNHGLGETQKEKLAVRTTTEVKAPLSGSSWAP